MIAGVPETVLDEPTVNRDRRSSVGRHRRARLMSRGSGGVGLGAAIAFCSALPFVLSPVRANVLGPDGRGYFAFFQSSLTLISTVASAGTVLAFYSSKIKPEDSGRVSLWRTGLLTVTVSLTILLLLAYVAWVKYGAIVAVPILVAAALTPLWLTSQFEMAVYQVGGRRRRVGTVVAGKPVVEFVGTSVLWATTRLTTSTAIVLTFLAEVYQFVVTSISRFRSRWSSRRVRSEPDSAADERRFRAGVLRLAPLDITPMLMASADILLFGLLISAGELGIYAVARLGAVLLIPAVAGFHGRLLQSADRKHALKAVVKVFWLAAVASIGLGVGGYILIPRLYGAAFQDAGPLFVICVVAGLVRVVQSALTVCVVRMGRTAVATKGAFLSVLLLSVGALASGTAGDLRLPLMCLTLALSSVPTVFLLVIVVRREAL